MAIVQFECRDDDVSDAVDAVSALVIGRPRIFTPQPSPTSPKKAGELEATAQAIAKVVRPRANQSMRLEILKLVLKGGDTWFDQNGEPDPGLRNATGALSKALRPFSTWDSPLDLICTRKREVVHDGAYKGRYQGTRYIPTQLGGRVKQILEEQGVI